MVVGELSRGGLAEDQAAGLLEERDARGVGLRAVAAVDRRAVLGRQVRRVDDVLDADRHAVQARTGGHAGEGAGLRENLIALDERPGPHLGFARGDALETGGGARPGGGVGFHALRTIADLRSLSVGAPTCCMIAASSMRRISRTRSTPGCPNAPSPQMYGRPTH